MNLHCNRHPHYIFISKDKHFDLKTVILYTSQLLADAIYRMREEKTLIFCCTLLCKSLQITLFYFCQHKHYYSRQSLLSGTACFSTYVQSSDPVFSLQLFCQVLSINVPCKQSGSTIMFYTVYTVLCTKMHWFFILVNIAVILLKLQILNVL